MKLQTDEITGRIYQDVKLYLDLWEFYKADLTEDQFDKIAGEYIRYKLWGGVAFRDTTGDKMVDNLIIPMMFLEEFIERGSDNEIK